jgi:hypothetical protein
VGKDGVDIVIVCSQDILLESGCKKPLRARQSTQAGAINHNAAIAKDKKRVVLPLLSVGACAG